MENLYQQIERLGVMIKQAGVSPLQEQKPKLPKPNSLTVPKVKPTGIPEISMSVSKPKFSHQMKDNSPYNER